MRTHETQVILFVTYHTDEVCVHFNNKIPLLILKTAKSRLKILNIQQDACEILTDSYNQQNATFNYAVS